MSWWVSEWVSECVRGKEQERIEGDSRRNRTAHSIFFLVQESDLYHIKHSDLSIYLSRHYINLFFSHVTIFIWSLVGSQSVRQSVSGRKVNNQGRRRKKWIDLSNTKSCRRRKQLQLCVLSVLPTHVRTCVWYGAHGFWKWLIYYFILRENPSEIRDENRKGKTEKLTRYVQEQQKCQ